MLFVFTILAHSINVKAQDEHSHHHNNHAVLSLNNGEKWQTDAPLRESMESPRQYFVKRLDDIHSGAFAANEYQELGNITKTTVHKIIEECQLPEDADAQLHILVAQMLQGAEQLTQLPATEKPGKSAHQIALAILNYGKYFNHPG